MVLTQDLTLFLILLQKSINNKYGYTPKAVAKSMYKFNKYIIDEICDIVPAVKPQIAMYERYGIEGMKAYAKTCEYAKAKVLL